MRVWRRLGPLLAVVLVLNFIPGVSAATPAAAQERPALTYFALGDSYASGHGLLGDVGADKKGKYGAGDVRNCRRSQIAYPYLVAGALGASYTVDFDSEHHLACSGATAGPYTMKSNDETYHVDKSISSQVTEVYRFLDQRDSTGSSDPVLVTITIGANDIGLMDPDTWGQVSRRPNLGLRSAAVVTGLAVPVLGLPLIGGAVLPTTSAVEFFEWLDAESAAIYSALTPVIDNLLVHENVYIILTDYPNPFSDPDNAFFDFFCNDIFLSLNCYEAMDHIVRRLRSVTNRQFLSVNQPDRLEVVSLGASFSTHTVGASTTWFQGDFAHPNQSGAQGIADVVVEVARDMLPEPIPVGSGPAGAIAVIGGGYTGPAATGTTSTGTVLTGPAVELILDTSDSMNERDQGSQTRLEVAKSVTTRLVTETLPAGVPMALRTYSGCSSSLAIPLQPLDPNAATGTIANLRASGKTPIAQSLRAAGNDLDNVSGPKIIVLVTDGEETCGGDPQAAIEALVAQDFSVHVNIVGFAIDDAELTATFQDWARIGNGSYFEASNELELDRAVTSASQLPFRVLDQQGIVTAEGAVGGEPVSVPAGTWTVEVDTVPLTRVDDVVVTAQETTTIDLDALGGTGGVPAGPVDLLSILPTIADVPGGLVETGRRTRTMPEVAANYTDAAETTQLFTAWGWQGNAVASFALPSGQEAQSGQVNGVYVSIHQFGSSDAAREALDFSIPEQAAGTVLQEITTQPLGEHTRALYGPEDYGNETTVLVQQGSFLIRVSAAMLDGDPTGETVAVAEAILLKIPAQQATIIDQGTGSSGGAMTGSQEGNAQVIVPDNGVPSSAGSAQRTWTASVQVSLCDASTCQAGAGITVDISLASGEWLGSCTTSEPMPTPWDVFISTCAVEGLPYYEDFVATQDPSTIPEGYAPANDPQTLHVEDIHPGGGDEAVFMFTNVRTDAGASTSVSPGTSASTGPSASTEVAASVDPMSLLPSSADVPGGLVETGRYTRALPDVVANYTDPAETTQLFTGWGWQENAVVSFALPSGQEAQSGQVNGVYVSIHQFGSADAAREALDFSIAEQAAGTALQEITTLPLGEYTRALYGPESYGNETTVLVQQGSVLIRVSAAMLDGDPTAQAVAVTEAILLKIPTQQATTIDQGTSGTTGSAITADSGSSSGTGGLAVQFWDVRNNVPDTTSQCVQLVGATEVLCANEFPDGQIQANGIPAGTYEVCVTRFYPDVPGEPVWAWFRSPASVTIAPGSHETITFKLYLDFEPGERTLCGFDDTTSDSNGNASSDTSSSVTAPDSSGSATTPDSGNSTEATLLMTFRGCPEGFDPAIGDFYAECTEPLDAPDASFISWGGDGQGGMNIWELDREYNGEYVHNAKSATMNLRITGLAPVVRDDYQVFGADGADGDGYTVHLADGETREVYVFYWFR